MTLAVSALILAGGQSSRMGQDKALISINGVALIRRVYEAAAPHCSPVFVVSAWGDRYRTVLPNECQFIVEVPSNQTWASQNSSFSISDRPLTQSSDRPSRPSLSPHLSDNTRQSMYTHGPLIGFYQGLSYLWQAQATCKASDIQNSNNKDSQGKVSGDWVLLLACDLPNLNPTVIQRWYNCLALCPDSTIALLPPHATKGWHPLCGFYHRRCFPSLEQFISQGGRSFQKWLATEEVRSLPVEDPSLLFNCNTPDDLKRVNGS